ncbi:ubiquitin-like protein Pup [Saccharopolyspora aridisoli]|uniref:Prokaryotic ubiquitin-like protein Pup n=1 Tax=Saccharopolyspora aridisoli TaxID=2530385 RepID=A0A4V2Y7U3_9PSEU|nr:ubiquitin-like protein Pup [Saccharopolyspora aridisoli]TDC93425.1 ubiquitin-like protein Pup [Saccharopolyspora aridisoli]
MHRERPRTPAKGDEEAERGPATSGQQRRERLDETTDDLLDDIDDVLEEDPQTFVRGYVQKNGQ